MKYKKEYLTSENKEDFIDKLLTNYPKLKHSTAIRRWYDYVPKKRKIKRIKKEIKVVYKQVEKEIKVVYEQDEITQPSLLKKREVADMKQFKYKVTRDFLRKYGYSFGEINWFNNNGDLDV